MATLPRIRNLEVYEPIFTAIEVLKVILGQLEDAPLLGESTMWDGQVTDAIRTLRRLITERSDTEDYATRFDCIYRWGMLLYSNGYPFHLTDTHRRPMVIHWAVVGQLLWDWGIEGHQGLHFINKLVLELVCKDYHGGYSYGLARKYINMSVSRLIEHRGGNCSIRQLIEERGGEELELSYMRLYCELV